MQYKHDKGQTVTPTLAAKVIALIGLRYEY